MAGQKACACEVAATDLHASAGAGGHATELDPAVGRIITLEWSWHGHGSGGCVALVAQSHCHPSGEPGDVVVVNASFVPKLTVLTTTGGRDLDFLPFLGPCPQLLELRLKGAKLTAELVTLLKKSCPRLQLLKVSLVSLTGQVSNLLKLHRACALLQELILHGLQGVTVTKVAAAFPHIKRLILNGQFHTGPYDTFDYIAEMFVDFHGRFAVLEYLNINGFAYDRKENRLDGRNCQTTGMAFPLIS